MNYGKPEVGRLYSTRCGDMAMITKIDLDFKIYYPVFGYLINDDHNLPDDLENNHTWTRKGRADADIEEHDDDLMEWIGDKNTHPEYFL